MSLNCQPIVLSDDTDGYSQQWKSLPARKLPSLIFRHRDSKRMCEEYNGRNQVRRLEPSSLPYAHLLNSDAARLDNGDVTYQTP
jgi:hypothetical protein